MNLDTYAGLLCGVLAISLFSLFIVSSPKRRLWLTIPAYVRGGFLMTGFLMMWRSVNFLSLANSTAPLGHINAEGMMPLLALTYTMTAFSLHWWRRSLPAPGWDRVEHVQDQMRHGADAVPVMMTGREVRDVARASGLPTTEPGEGAGGVARELRRQAG